jgi:hypothetical protein
MRREAATSLEDWKTILMGILLMVIIMMGAGWSSTQARADAVVQEATLTERMQKIYAVRGEVLLAVDKMQNVAWYLAQQTPTDGVLEWYDEVNMELNAIECELVPEDCE